MSGSVERTALYRYFNANDDLLYIGISNDPDFREKAHRYETRPGNWPKEAARREVDWFDSRAAALAAEAAAISSERPRYNRAHNYDDASFSPESWPKAPKGQKVAAIADLIRAEIASGNWAPGQRIPSLHTLGDAAGASARVVSQASVLLQADGLLDLQPGRGIFVAQQIQRRDSPC